MLKIAICDDEDFFRNKTEKLVSDYLESKTNEYEIDAYETGNSLLLSNLNVYDIIFLDINMEGLDGINTAKEIREINSTVFIVFITAFVDYAVQGYMVDAIRYILKDMMEGMIPEALDTIIKKINMCQNRVTYPFLSGEKTIYTDKIIYIESRGHKLYFNISEKSKVELSIYKKLDEVEEQLEKSGFIRPHKSFLVNVKYIKNITGFTMNLKNGVEISISRSKLQSVKEKYLRYKGEM